MSKSVGIGWGKAILFGEHFVVYRMPGIAASIELNTTCTFRKNKKNENGIFSNDLVTGEIIKYAEHKYKKLDQVIDVVLRETGIKERNFHLDLETNMSLQGGMGSSAALCVSIARCLDKEFKLKLSDVRINEISFEAEKIFHGSPSGIDNSVSTFGGMIFFVKQKTKNIIERIKIKKPVEAVLSDTGVIHDTAQLVEMVKGQKVEQEKKYEKIFSSYNEIINSAREKIEGEKWGEIGELMDRNQKLLKEINVSSKENDLLVDIAKNSGALGAKITGAGLGGNVLALTPGKALQQKVAIACEKEGFKAYKVKLGMMV